MRYALILSVILLTIPARAQNDSTADREREADRYLKATPPKEMFEDLAEQMAKNLSATEREKFKALLLKHLDIPALTQAMKSAMVKNFTAQELKALADFYGSPVGKSAMKKFGTYMADVMPDIQAEMIKAQAKANREEKSPQKAEKE